MKTYASLAFAAILIVVAITFGLMQPTEQEQLPPEEVPSNTVSLGGGKVEHSDKEKYIVAMPEGENKYADLNHGDELWFAITPLEGVEGTLANGVSQAYYYESGMFRHDMRLHIEIPKDGYFYEGWLVHPNGDFISTGHVRNSFGDVRHFLQFSREEDLREYEKVVITLEPDDGNPEPAIHVAEGTFTAHRR